MNYLKIPFSKISQENRWDIDYHLPPVEIKKYNNAILCKIESCADIIKDNRNPMNEPDKEFIYIDISSIDVTVGMIINPQELIGEEAPSRARKVIKTNDIIISTCRPTRGAIAIVPKELDNQICSTGFSVIRAKPHVDVRYLHFILRSDLVKEQFRKFSTGSSYPAILDSDVKKTIIPLPKLSEQKNIADLVVKATQERNMIIDNANSGWSIKLNHYLDKIKHITE